MDGNIECNLIILPNIFGEFFHVSLKDNYFPIILLCLYKGNPSRIKIIYDFNPAIQALDHFYTAPSLMRDGVVEGTLVYSFTELAARFSKNPIIFYN